MSEKYKEQHYVPRCYLKEFSEDDSQIDIYLIEACRWVKGASLKKQCKKPYLYAPDGSIERKLSVVEGLYRSLVTSLDGTRRLEVGEEYLLRSFACLQMVRTLHSIRNLEAGWSGITRILSRDGSAAIPDGMELGPHDAAQLSLSMVPDVQKASSDLKALLIFNETGMPYHSSDNPLVFGNKYLGLTKGEDNYGVTSSGACVLLPLRRDLLFMMYDKSVYDVSGSFNGYISTHKRSDIEAINSMQWVQAMSSIYPSGDLSEEMVQALLKERHEQRPVQFQRTGELRKRGENDTGEFYSARTEDDPEFVDSSIIRMSTIHPIFKKWPSFVRYKSKPRYIHTGTGRGTIRPTLADGI